MEKEVFAVSDVYDHAASIGKDIEQIVQEYGKESIEGKNIIFTLIYFYHSRVYLFYRKSDFSTNDFKQKTTSFKLLKSSFEGFLLQINGS